MIPARNEEVNIKRCLYSLIDQSYKNLEIIVLDDDSDDQTYNIVKDVSKNFSSIKLIKGERKLNGWTGKNWACHQLSKFAKGDFLLFIDADTKLQKNIISETVSEMNNNDVDLISLFPNRITNTAIDKIISVTIGWFIFSCLPIIFSNKNPMFSSAFGQFLLFRKGAYFSIGGHESIKDKIRKEFDTVLSLLDFDVKGHDIFRRWYIDGRIFYHKVIDKKNPKAGVVEVRYIDPRKIRKVRQVNKDKKPGSTMDMIKSVDDFYLYNDKGLNAGQMTEGIKIADDSITYVVSGLIDQNKGHVLSHLHKAIKPVNQLRMIEDSVVIYRISRAPERRIFYIDVGNLPKVKAEQYLKDIMDRYRNKLVYDANTGEIRDDKKFMSMLEDFWLPRREGGTGTSIDTLPAGQNLGQIEDVEYFQRKLYQRLKFILLMLIKIQSGIL